MNGRPDVPDRYGSSPVRWPPLPGGQQHTSAPTQATRATQAARPERGVRPDDPARPRWAAEDDTSAGPGEDTAEFTTSHGELPLPSLVPDVDDDIADAPTIRRTKITLTPPGPSTPRSASPGTAHVYTAPTNGLGKFDLGSVPASVTPPPTWRKAAWFATLSSGAVVVALLVAGTALVSSPGDDTRAVESWPDRGGHLPVTPGQGHPDDTENRRDVTGSVTATSVDTDEVTGDHRASLRDTSPERGGSSGASSGSDGAANPDPGDDPSSGAVPRKPPVTPAATSTARPTLWAPHDAETLAQRSQDYLDTVTEDPEAAHALTTGELAEQGPEELARRYADIAYFEVRHIYIDTNEGYTLNTVTVTHTDGRTTEETRKLVFGTDDLISTDGG